MKRDGAEHRLMKGFVSFLLLIAALGMAVSAAVLLAKGRPAVPMALHGALVEGNEEYAKVLKKELETKRLAFKVTVALLLVGSASCAVLAYLISSNDSQ